jgi:acetylglutamate kinase
LVPFYLFLPSSFFLIPSRLLCYPLLTSRLFSPLILPLPLPSPLPLSLPLALLQVLWDNDSLAMLVSHEIGVELMILLSDVEGLYRHPPSPERPRPEVIHTYSRNTAKTATFNIGDKSRVGRGGMQAKIDAALKANSS